MARRDSTTKGFKQTASLLTKQIRAGAESRGFAESRLLTRWPEIAGPEIAQIARPVDIRYGRSGVGAILTLLTTGAQAPLLDMQKETLRARVNAIYGYNAVTRIRITQTAPTGFAEGQVAFAHKPAETRTRPSPDAHARGAHAVSKVEDEGLRAALSKLGANILSR